MDFLWEDSTGARAVKLLREKEEALRCDGKLGFVIDTISFAKVLDVKPGALHQLLANAQKLNLIRKVYGLGPRVGWKLGPGGDSVTIERRRTPRALLTSEELHRRVAANASRRARAELKRLPMRRMEATFAPDMPPWLGGPGRSHRPDDPLQAALSRSRPSTYLARWHVLYRDERGQIHADVQVQAVHADLGVVDAWCDARGGIDRFALSGFARVADADSGEPIDLFNWLERHRHSRRARSAASKCRPASEVRKAKRAPTDALVVA